VPYSLPVFLFRPFSPLQCPNKIDAQKSLATLAVSSFDIPGDRGFPLNAFLSKPANRAESGEWSGVRDEEGGGGEC